MHDLFSFELISAGHSSAKSSFSLSLSLSLFIRLRHYILKYPVGENKSGFGLKSQIEM